MKAVTIIQKKRNILIQVKKNMNKVYMEEEKLKYMNNIQLDKHLKKCQKIMKKTIEKLTQTKNLSKYSRENKKKDIHV